MTYCYSVNWSISISLISLRPLRNYQSNLWHHPRIQKHTLFPYIGCIFKFIVCKDWPVFTHKNFPIMQCPHLPRPHDMFFSLKGRSVHSCTHFKDPDGPESSSVISRAADKTARELFNIGPWSVQQFWLQHLDFIPLLIRLIIQSDMASNLSTYSVLLKRGIIYAIRRSFGTVA